MKNKNADKIYRHFFTNQNQIINNQFIIQQRC